jgi:superfamily I DNA/RNA helicase
VVADEVQDLGAPELRLLRAIVPPGPEDLFLVGDAHQRIYRGAVSLGLCGIETRGRSRRLKINYRTTKEVRDWAVAIVANRKVDDLDDGEDSLAGYRSLRSGTAPTVRQFRTPEEESRFILATVGAWRKTGKTEEICIAARTHRQIHEVYEPMLRAADVPTLVLDKDAEDAAQPGVRLATMHRFKGLEFPRVLLVGVQDGAIPLLLPKAELYDAATTEEHLEQERRLLFVAATRARDELVVTGYGKPSSFFEPSP